MRCGSAGATVLGRNATTGAATEADEKPGAGKGAGAFAEGMGVGGGGLSWVSTGDVGRIADGAGMRGCAADAICARAGTGRKVVGVALPAAGAMATGAAAGGGPVMIGSACRESATTAVSLAPGRRRGAREKDADGAAGTEVAGGVPVGIRGTSARRTGVVAGAGSGVAV